MFTRDASEPFFKQSTGFVWESFIRYYWITFFTSVSPHPSLTSFIYLSHCLNELSASCVVETENIFGSNNQTSSSYLRELNRRRRPLWSFQKWILGKTFWKVIFQTVAVLSPNSFFDYLHSEFYHQQLRQEWEIQNFVKMFFNFSSFLQRVKIRRKFSNFSNREHTGPKATILDLDHHILREIFKNLDDIDDQWLIWSTSQRLVQLSTERTGRISVAEQQVLFSFCSTRSRRISSDAFYSFEFRTVD